MRLSLSIAAVLLLAGSACAQPARSERNFLPADGRISFTIEPHQRAGMVQFQLSRREGRSHWSHGRSIEASALEGYGAADGPVRFRLARDAGTIACDGVMRAGRAIGECSFAADAGFAALLAERGMGTPTRDQSFSMAMSDIGRAYIDELARQRYDAPSAADLARAGDHGVTMDYLVRMGGHGYRVGRLASLVQMRGHGVTPDYVAELAQLGVRDVSPEDIVRMRDHGVQPAFVAALRGHGYQDLPIDQLINLRDHGVTADYVGRLADHGVRGVPPAELTRMRDHGVSPDFVGALRASGFTGFGTSEIIRLRDHGVSGDFVGALASLGYGALSADEVVQLRIHGVTADFIRRANSGGERRSADELVRLRLGS